MSSFQQSGVSSSVSCLPFQFQERFEWWGMAYEPVNSMILARYFMTSFALESFAYTLWVWWPGLVSVSISNSTRQYFILYLSAPRWWFPICKQAFAPRYIQIETDFSPGSCWPQTSGCIVNPKPVYRCVVWLSRHQLLPNHERKGTRGEAGEVSGEFRLSSSFLI